MNLIAPYCFAVACVFGVIAVAIINIYDSRKITLVLYAAGIFFLMAIVAALWGSI